MQKIYTSRKKRDIVVVSKKKDDIPQCTSCNTENYNYHVIHSSMNELTIND